jgi:pimeloyl-ACP methyl ester carboxylesterase
MSNGEEEFDKPDSVGRLSRRSVLWAATVGAAAAPWFVADASPAGAQPAAAQNPAALANLPGLPAGFWTRFTSRRVRVDGMRLHVVTGGHGPAVLLICGWPQIWYAWRHVMHALARNFSVVALDPRGVGLSDKPASGYDSGTLAGDAVKLMRVLGHERFALVTHDVGAWTGYALASDYPAAVARFVAMETITPGLTEPGALLLPGPINNLLWHFPFNRVEGINEQLVRGREDIYFGYQFASKAATATSVPAYAVRVYVDALRRPGALAPCAAASSSIARSTRSSPRTTNASRPASRCRSWPSGANGPSTPAWSGRCAPSLTTSAVRSSPEPVTS